jgi:hypothetical protein
MKICLAKVYTSAELSNFSLEFAQIFLIKLRVAMTALKVTNWPMRKANEVGFEFESGIIR